MPKDKQSGVQPQNLDRAEEIQRQIQQLSGRDLQLWSIGLLMIVVLTGGFVAVILPNLLWAQHLIRLERVDAGYLPQLFFGLISLVLLFNIYLIAQKRTLNSTRRALIHELVLNERLESLSLIDPLTQLPNRRAMNEFIPREVTRVNRSGGNLTFMALDLNGFKKVNEKFGTLEGDAVLVEISKMLKEVFRGADIIFRQGGDEFLVMMPDTSEQQADPPTQRLIRGIEQWNLNNRKGYEISLSYALSGYVIGSDYTDVLRSLDRKVYGKKHNLMPVF
jgi:diguanylate cyclase (GGDEF)-like protein